MLLRLFAGATIRRSIRQRSSFYGGLCSAATGSARIESLPPALLFGFERPRPAQGAGSLTGSGIGIGQKARAGRKLRKVAPVTKRLAASTSCGQFAVQP